MLYLIAFFLILIAVCYFWILLMKIIGLFIEDREAQEKKWMWARQLEEILENQAKAARIAEYTKHAPKF